MHVVLSERGDWHKVGPLIYSLEKHAFSRSSWNALCVGTLISL